MDSSITLIKNWQLLSKSDKYGVSKLQKKNTDKEFLRMADKMHEHIFKQINCLDCANCCKRLPPIINENDCKRIAKFMGIKVADFKNIYTAYDSDDDLILKETPCPFLLPDNKCKIYDCRPKSCREYPHTNNGTFVKNNNLHKINVLYCPAVYYILERLKNSF